VNFWTSQIKTRSYDGNNRLLNSLSPLLNFDSLTFANPKHGSGVRGCFVLDAALMSITNYDDDDIDEFDIHVDEFEEASQEQGEFVADVVFGAPFAPPSEPAVALPLPLPAGPPPQMAQHRLVMVRAARAGPFYEAPVTERELNPSKKRACQRPAVDL
jgi:hypothetical protein